MTEVEAGKDIVSILMGPGGVIFIFLVMVVGVARRWLIPGWVYDSVIKDFDSCRVELSSRISATEAEVREYRKSRGGSDGH